MPEKLTVIDTPPYEADISGETGRISSNLQDRLTAYIERIKQYAANFPDTKIGRHVCSRILRSGTCLGEHHGQAQSAGTGEEGVCKLRIVLNELRETDIWLKIIDRTGLIPPSKELAGLLEETRDLISVLLGAIGNIYKT